MSKYKVGDKVVMEITDKISVMEEPWYVLSKSISTSIEQTRAEGQNEAWELARKIVLMEKEGGMKDEDYKAIFGGCQPSDYILKTHTYPEAAAKVEAWEKAKEMSVESAIGNLTALKHDYENENNEDERHFNIALGMAIKALKQIGEE